MPLNKTVPFDQESRDTVVSLPVWHTLEQSDGLPELHIMATKATISAVLEQRKGKKGQMLVQLRLLGRTVDLIFSEGASLPGQGGVVTLVFTSPYRLNAKEPSAELQRYLSHYQFEGLASKNLCAVDSNDERCMPVWYLKHSTSWKEVSLGHLACLCFAVVSVESYFYVTTGSLAPHGVLLGAGSVLWHVTSTLFFISYPFAKRRSYTKRFSKELSAVVARFCTP